MRSRFLHRDFFGRQQGHCDSLPIGCGKQRARGVPHGQARTSAILMIRSMEAHLPHQAMV